MIVDVNTHISLSGKGEKKTREYYVGYGNNRQKRYDADVYQGSIQVTGAVFGDALSVSTKLLEEHWKSMVANDSQIVTNVGETAEISWNFNAN